MKERKRLNFAGNIKHIYKSRYFFVWFLSVLLGEEHKRNFVDEILDSFKVFSQSARVIFASRCFYDFVVLVQELCEHDSQRVAFFLAARNGGILVCEFGIVFRAQASRNENSEVANYIERSCFEFAFLNQKLFDLR